jgi:hypothetical protein
MSQVLGYGFVSDSDESLKTKSGAKFGGNFGVATLAKFAYSPNVAKEGQEPREAIEVTVKVGDKEYKDWINPVNRVVDKNNTEIADKSSVEYINGFNALMSQQNATVTHYLKAVGVTEEALRAAFINPVVSFADYAARICSLLPIGFDKKPLDLFLEFQWNFGKKADGSINDKTYPTLPKNMKGGYFIVPAQPGVWIEERAENQALCYKNSNGQKHPFERDANFMTGNKGTQQVLGQTAASTAMGAPAPSVAGNPGGSW